MDLHRYAAEPFRRRHDVGPIRRRHNNRHNAAMDGQDEDARYEVGVQRESQQRQERGA